MEKRSCLILSLGFLLLGSCGGPSGSEATSVSSIPSSSGSVCVPGKEDKKVHLVILAGQSGARGKARVADLTDEEKLELPSPNIDILADGMMMGALSSIPSSPNSSASIKALDKGLGDTAAEFGPELGLAQTLATAYPKNSDAPRCVIIKYTASGSTFYNHWQSSSLLEEASVSTDMNQVRKNPTTGKLTGALTNNLYQLIDMAKSQLTGYELTFDGCVFVHGEQDAKFDANMAIYEKALEDWKKDLRAYVGEENMPFVITEALTNSAKYSNSLRAIQKKVAEADSFCRFVDTSDLKTNTFEPWHFGAESNYVLGNRSAAELLDLLGDRRVITNFVDNAISLPKDEKVALPLYEKAVFDNGLEGYVKVKNGNYDEKTLGEQEIPYEATLNCKKSNGVLKATIREAPFVDGVPDDPSYGSPKALPNSLGSLKIAKTEEGLYVGAEVTDSDVWSDGEAWEVGDMGQYKNNDDLEIFLMNGKDTATRYTVCLSSAGLLRVYGMGVSLSAASPILLSNNLYYHKLVDNFAFKAITKGLVNCGQSEGVSFEVFIPYDDLSLSADDLRICFKYSNVGGVIADGKVTKSETANYLVKAEGDETSLSSYFSLSEL